MSRRPPVVDHWAALHQGFHWRVPSMFNIADVCCARWARHSAGAMRVAIHWERDDGSAGAVSYGALHQQAGRLSHALQRLGVDTGDRVAIVLPQRPETAVSHLACYQMGAVAMPLSMLFGPEALQFRLADSGARVAIADASMLPVLRGLRASCPALQAIVVVGAEVTAAARGSHEAGSAGGGHEAGSAGGGHEAGSPGGGHEAAWEDLLDRERPVYAPHLTRADDPALLIYTSGTTGPPKGALVPHRALIGNLTGFVCSQNWFGAEAGGVFWSPADWAWTGGLMDALLPTLYFGREIVAYQGRFAPEKAFELMQRHRVTHAFLFPTALKAMMKAVPEPRGRYRLELKALMSAGEAVGDAVYAWCREHLGVPVNEMFGQTEINYVVGNCGSYVDAQGHRHPAWPSRPGSMGRAYPGHRVAVIDDDGREVPRGTVGEVAVHRRDVHGDPDPVFFLGYWNNPAATAAKYTGDPGDSWCRTGDTAVMDEAGYLWYRGRSDDMFKAAGYRIGPSEIENCLVKHPAVANAAVFGKPDRDRGALIKACIVLAPGALASPRLVEELQQHVRSRLAPYEVPKEIEFVDALPMTTTGKVQRRVLREREAARISTAAPPSASAPRRR